MMKSRLLMNGELPKISPVSGLRSGAPGRNVSAETIAIATRV